MIYVFVALFLIGRVKATFSMSGICPPVQAMKDLNITKLTGRWYESEKWSPPYADSDCTTTDYNLGEDDTIEVNMTQVYPRFGVTLNLTGIMRIHDASQPGKLKIKWKQIEQNDNKELDVWVLETDYDSFAVMYTCINHDRVFLYYRFVRILTRDPLRPIEVMKKVDAVLKSQSIQADQFRPVTEVKCTFGVD